MSRPESSRLALAPDAAMVVGIASTALPFARTAEAAAERWLRVMRMHGEVGIALEALGVSEGPIEERAEGSGQGVHPERAGGSTDSQGTDEKSIDPEESVREVTERAGHIATERGAQEIATTDVLMAVMHLYGADFDRVLRAHGTDSDALIEQLGGGALARRQS
jgi:hypothetical protein